MVELAKAVRRVRFNQFTWAEVTCIVANYSNDSKCSVNEPNIYRRHTMFGRSKARTMPPSLSNSAAIAALFIRLLIPARFGYSSLISLWRFLPRRLLPEVVRRTRTAVPEVRRYSARAVDWDAPVYSVDRKRSMFYWRLCRCHGPDDWPVSHLQQSRHAIMWPQWLL